MENLNNVLNKIDDFIIISPIKYHQAIISDISQLPILVHFHLYSQEEFIRLYVFDIDPLYELSFIDSINVQHKINLKYNQLPLMKNSICFNYINNGNNILLANCRNKFFTEKVTLSIQQPHFDKLLTFGYADDTSLFRFLAKQKIAYSRITLQDFDTTRYYQECNNQESECEYVINYIHYLLKLNVPATSIKIHCEEKSYIPIISNLANLANIDIECNLHCYLAQNLDVQNYLLRLSKLAETTIEQELEEISNSNIQPYIKKLLNNLLVTHSYVFTCLYDNASRAKAFEYYASSIVINTTNKQAIQLNNYTDAYISNTDYLICLGTKQGYLLKEPGKLLFLSLEQDKIYTQDCLKNLKYNLENFLTRPKQVLFTSSKIINNTPCSDHLMFSALGLRYYYFSKLELESYNVSANYDLFLNSIGLSKFEKIEVSEENYAKLAYYNSYYSSFNLDHKLSNIDVFDLLKGDKVNLSYTSIDMLFNCPYAYFLQHLLRLKKSQNDSLASLLGSSVHAYLHSYFAKVPLELPENVKNNSLNKFYYDLELTYVKKFLDFFTARLDLNKLKVKDSELRFSYEINKNFNFVGSIDAVLVKNGEYVFVDFKNKTNPELDYSKIKYGQGLQLNYYAYFYSKLNKLDSEKIYGYGLQGLVPTPNKDKSQLFNDSFYFFKDDLDGFNTKASEKDSYSMTSFNSIIESNLTKAIKTINSGNFEATQLHINKGSSCQYCTFANICHKHRIHNSSYLQSINSKGVDK
jgi:hypothetical protein